MNELTEILQAVDRGDAAALQQLLTIVYDELRRIATGKLAHERPGQTLQTTALVHEAYLRLLGAESTSPEESEAHDGLDDSDQATWRSRGHFFAAAAESMRRILIDNARKKKRIKRGGDRARVDFEDIQLADSGPSVDLLALNEALLKLEAEDPAKAAVVKLRFFAGLTLEEAGTALGVSVPTVHRHWRFARAWLRRELEKGESGAREDSDP